MVSGKHPSLSLTHFLSSFRDFGAPFPNDISCALFVFFLPCIFLWQLTFHKREITRLIKAIGVMLRRLSCHGLIF